MTRARSSLLRSTLAVWFLAGAAAWPASAQTDCVSIQGNTRSLLPKYSGTINGNALSTAQGSKYLYVMTQWGFARAPLTDPSRPAPLLLAQIGKKTAGGNNGGVVPATCDCWQGGITFDVAEARDGSARMIADWSAAKQGGGLPAQMAAAVGTAKPVFAQQIQLDGTPVGIRVAAIRLSNGKYVGYIPGRYNATGGIQLVDLTDYNSDPRESDALRPFSTFSSWSANRLYATHVSVPGYEKPLLFGFSTTEKKLFVAEINATTGSLIDKTVGPTVAGAKAFSVAVVEGRIFIFSAEGTAGLQVYEYQPGSFGGSITNAGSIAGDFTQVVVKDSGGPFPVIFSYRNLSPTSSSVEIYDTKWLTQGGSPVKAGSLVHLGGTERFVGTSVEAVVIPNGPTVTAYVYRVVTALGSETEASIRTDKVDISCVSLDPLAPPVANAALTNLSAASRTGAEASRNYFGDRWRVRDASASAAALDRIEWDIVSTGPFAADAAWSGALPAPALSIIEPAYWPCNPASGGNPVTGSGCHASLGAPASGGNYSIGLRTRNANGWSAAYLSSPISVLSPRARVAGFDEAAGRLSVLSGGTANASGSDGNTGEASFAWTFPGASPPSGSGAAVSIPTNATSFTLNVDYPGGYRAQLSGSIVQSDLVADFSMTPNPVVTGGALTLTNRMEKGVSTTLASVEYAITSSATPPASFGAALAASFLPVNGTTTVGAPASSGAHWMHLRYTFSGPHGANQTRIVSRAFDTVVFSAAPIVGVYLNAARSLPAPFFGSYILSVGTTYYLFDDETLPSGTPHPGARFYLSANGSASTVGDTDLGASAGAGPVAWTPTAGCATCYLKAAVGVSVAAARISMDGAPAPPSVTSALPDSGSAAGGARLTVTGSGFVSGATVRVGGVLATAVTFRSSTQIEATVPRLSAGTLNDVRVTNRSGQSGTLAKRFLADFADVPASHPFHDHIETIFRSEVTAGCGGGNFCPNSLVPRDQMAVFLMKGEHGAAWTPPLATGTVFSDVPASAFGAAWIETLAAEGITAGCGGGRYCPSSLVTRAEMAVFLIKTTHGSTYTPPPATGVFADVVPGSFAAGAIEQLYAEGITSGCGGGNFCPGDPVTRGQMTVFLARAFELP